MRLSLQGKIISIVPLMFIATATTWLAFQGPSQAVLARYSTPLTGRMSSQKHNALRSIRHLNGCVIQPGETFSFNAKVGTWSRDQGYRKAPISYNGQLISSWGGGVCQTSTTLYNVALLAGMKIVERHPHQFAPSYVPPGRDAAVAFDNIDLKFMNPHPFPVEIRDRSQDGLLTLEMAGKEELIERPEVVQEITSQRQPDEYQLPQSSHARRLRNSGKPGYEVVVYRLWPSHREVISTDSYPVMNRLIERS